MMRVDEAERQKVSDREEKAVFAVRSQDGRTGIGKVRVPKLLHHVAPNGKV